MFAYRVGWPLWKLAARLNFPLKAKVFITFDGDAGVIVAECSDFQPYLGIVTEAPTKQELEKKLDCCFREAMNEAFKQNREQSVYPSFAFAPGQ